MSPSRLRGAAGDEPTRADAAATPSRVTLAYRAPYDAAALLRFLAQRAIPGIEEVDGR